MATPIEPRRQKADFLLTFPQPQYGDSEEGSPRSYTPSATSVSTLTEGNVGAASIGQYVEADDGDARGQVRQIKSRASTVATVDAPWLSVSGSTRWRAWTPADVPVRITTGGTTTTAICADHAGATNEPDNYYVGKGYYLYCVAGTNAGEARQITGFTQLSGTFTTAAFTNATAADELYLIGKPLRVEGEIECRLEQAFAERTNTGFADADQAVPLNYAGNIRFALPVRPLSAAAGSAVQATAPVEVGDMLADVMVQTRDTGAAAASSSPMSGAVLSLASGGSGFSVGGFVLCNSGEVGQIQSIATNDLTLGTGHVTASKILASSVVHASVWYKRKESDFRWRGFRYYRGRKFLQFLHGAMPSLSMELLRDGVNKWNMDYMLGGDAGEYNVDAPVAIDASKRFGYDDVGVPRDGKQARTLIAGVRVQLERMTINFGFQPGVRPSLQGRNQQNGCFMGLGPVGGEFTILADVDGVSSFKATVDRMRQGQPVDFLYQCGTAIKETFAVGIPAFEIMGAPFEYSEGLGRFSAKWTAVKPQFARGYSAHQDMPTIAVALL